MILKRLTDYGLLYLELLSQLKKFLSEYCLKKALNLRKTIINNGISKYQFCLGITMFGSNDIFLNMYCTLYLVFEV